MHIPQKRKKHWAILFSSLAAGLVLVLIAGILVLPRLPIFPEVTEPTQSSISLETEVTTNVTITTTEMPTEAPTEPPVTLEGSFTLSATGDILMHPAVIYSAVCTHEGYDYGNIFSYFTDYVSRADYAVANLETTLASTENGYEYMGYPLFNCPDGIIPSMKNAGFDMVLTANNHSYDTRGIGLRRTPKVIADYELQYLGTKQVEDEPNYYIVERNGIRLGLCCYTYENNNSVETKAPNGITMKDEDAPLINSFDYANVTLFYDEMQENIAQMKAAGVDSIVLFIHWGNEYKIKQNATQSAMAQALCDLGVDVIIGGHPHVVQPMELLTSTTDPDHKTVCIYSLGNAVSNQRIMHMDLKTGHTEDGMLFSITFNRYSDGTVILQSADVLPVWVDLRTEPSYVYAMLPLDTQIEDWKTQFDLTDDTLAQAQASYDRTMAIVGEGLTTVNAYLAQQQQQIESALGVS